MLRPHIGILFEMEREPAHSPFDFAPLRSGRTVVPDFARFPFVLSGAQRVESKHGRRHPHID